MNYKNQFEKEDDQIINSLTGTRVYFSEPTTVKTPEGDITIEAGTPGVVNGVVQGTAYVTPGDKGGSWPMPARVPLDNIEVDIDP